MYLQNLNGNGMSLQISKLKAIENLDTTDFDWKDGEGQQVPFLIKNDGDDDIELEVLMWDDSEYVSTLFTAGWNPELVRAVKHDISLSSYDLKAGR